LYGDQHNPVYGVLLFGYYGKEGPSLKHYWQKGSGLSLKKVQKELKP
jgi:hypothetical protein